jgi:hypothetical protein
MDAQKKMSVGLFKFMSYSHQLQSRLMSPPHVDPSAMPGRANPDAHNNDSDAAVCVRTTRK